MKNNRMLSMIAVVLTVSIFSVYVIADGNNENDQNDRGQNEETQIDEDLNRQILEYLENLDESELDPNRNEDHYEHRSDKEIIEQWEQEEREHPCGIEELPVLDDSNPPDRDTDPTGFYSIGSDLYYTDPVTNLHFVQDRGSLTLAWNANPEADGYLIYGYSNGQPYGYIGMTQLLVDPMFTDTSASSVIENHYWVFAYYIENNQIIPGLPSEELVGRAI